LRERGGAWLTHSRAGGRRALTERTRARLGRAPNIGATSLSNASGACRGYLALAALRAKLASAPNAFQQLDLRRRAKR
jgi:hypothetical protein